MLNKFLHDVIWLQVTLVYKTTYVKTFPGVLLQNGHLLLQCQAGKHNWDISGTTYLTFINNQLNIW